MNLPATLLILTDYPSTLPSTKVAPRAMTGTWADCFQNNTGSRYPREGALLFYQLCPPATLVPCLAPKCYVSNHKILWHRTISGLLMGLGSWRGSGSGLIVAWGDWVDLGSGPCLSSSASSSRHACLVMAEEQEPGGGTGRTCRAGLRADTLLSALFNWKTAPGNGCLYGTPQLWLTKGVCTG